MGGFIRINLSWSCVFRKRANTVSGETVSNSELSEFFGAHRAPGRELSEFLSAYYLCAKANSPSFPQNSPSLPQNSVSSLLRNSTLETVFRRFPSISIRATEPEQQKTVICTKSMVSANSRIRRGKGQGEKRHININFLLWLMSRWPWDKRLVVPGLTGPKSLCVRLETQEI